MVNMTSEFVRVGGVCVKRKKKKKKKERVLTEINKRCGYFGRERGKFQSVRAGLFVARFWIATHTTQVVHGPVEGKPHGLSVERRARLHQLQAVQRWVDPEGRHL